MTRDVQENRELGLLGRSPFWTWRYAAAVCGLACVYCASAVMGLAFAIPPGNSSVIWPASGIAVSALLLFGARVWPGIWLGAVFANLTTDAPPIAACAIGAGNTLEALLAAWLCRHVLLPVPFRAARDAFLFALVAAGSSVVAASVGVASLSLAGDIAWQETARNWGTWWLGDVAGQMIVVPFVLAIAGRHWAAASRLSLAELVLLLALMVLVGHAAFAGWFSERIAHDCRCLPAILLIWLGLRFRLLEVSGGIVLFAAAAFGGALQGARAGDLGDVHHALLDLQVLVNVYALTGLALVGIVAARRRAEGALTDSLQNLERLVSDRTRQLVEANEELQRKVAEHKKAVGTVRESERRFRTLFEQAGDALFVVSMDGQLVDFNRRAAEVLGYTRDELLRLRVPDIDVEHDSERFNQLAADMDPDSVTIVQSVCRRKDGATSPIEIRACAIELDGERHMLALVYDITSRKRVEEFERLQLDYVFDSIGDGVLVTNRDGTIQLVNPAFERITGYTRDELIGQNPRILQGGAHDRKFYEDMWKTLTDGHVWRGSFVDKRKDGALYDAEVTIAPVRAASGENGGYIAVTRDVSERNRMAQALRESEARMRAVVENATDGIITFNEQGQIESCNPAAAQIFAYSAEEMLDRHITLLLPGPWHAACGTSLEQFLHTGRCKTLDENRELVGKRKDGSQFPMELGVSKIQLGNRRLFTGIVRDTTERHARQKAERALLVNEASLRIARSIQQGFFPATAPKVPGLDIGGASFPAEATGGDYYDYLPMADHHLGIVLGDVSGHGIGPALLMSQTRAFLHALVPSLGDASDLVSRLNTFLTNGVNADHFVTLFLAQIDPRDRTFFYAGAGHNGFLFESDGTVHHLEATGFPLGVADEPIPNALPRSYAPGQILALLTDGIYETESRDEVAFGVPRALQFIWTNRDLSAEAIVNGLYRAVTDYAQGLPQQDDITVVIVKFE